jgi:DNA invertase Pin-like site-specific DNA recombinase
MAIKGKTVTMLPPTLDRQTKAVLTEHKKKRVAGYARVSTDLEEQENSFAAQVDYYTNFINKNPDWEFVCVYSDDGQSATSMKKREGFNRMIADALGGKLDYIVTKSVSRFARNTVDSLQTIRLLKEHGIFVWFDKEAIDTADAKGELLITLMSSLAQEESRSISENVTWGKRKAMADGKVQMTYKTFLGYEKGEDGEPKIVPEEAETVRLIYKMFLNGYSALTIAKHLTSKKIPTPAGCEKWGAHSIMSILRNEKYAGCNLTQKHYTESFLNKRQIKNCGELPQYWVDNSHPAIVSPETYDLVQEEIKRNAEVGKLRSTQHVFSSRIVCGECGNRFGRKTWSSTSKYKKIVWQCNGKYQCNNHSKRRKKKISGAQCSQPHLTDAQLEYAFITAFNQMAAVKEEYCREYETLIAELTDTDALDKEISAVNTEKIATYEKIEAAIYENSRRALNQDEYNERFEKINTRYDELKARLSELAVQRQSILARRERIGLFLAELQNCDALLEGFDEAIFVATVEEIIVNGLSDVCVKFRDGTKISVDVSDVAEGESPQE